MNFQVLTCLCLASSAASLNPLDIIPGNVVTKNSQLITFSPGRDNIPKAARSATILYAAPAKKSYSPFGGTKPFAPAADSLYCPPGTSSSAPNESFSEHAETDGAGLGSYLDVLGGTGSASMKKSYSPFGGSKPVAAASADSWYSPPATESSAPVESIPVDDSLDATYESVTEHAETDGAGLGSYLDVLGGTGSASMKKSYSPFGGSKPVAAASADSWYSPPATEPYAVDGSQSESYAFTEHAEPNGAGLGSCHDILGGTGSVSMKKSYSPFGGSKPVAAASADSWYSPPATEPYAVDGSQSESYAFTEHAEPNGAGLGSYHDILGGTGSVSMKKSYSPFGGSKPVAAASADSWYSPPATESFAPVESIPVDDSHDATYESVTEPVETNVARLGSKLEVLGGSGFVSMKKSYSPFGGSKPVAAGPANPLYSPPATVSKAPVNISEITKEVPKQVRKAITLQQRRTLKVTGPQSAEVSRVVPPPAKPSVDDDHRDLVNSVMAGGLLFLAVVVFLAQPW